MKVFGIIHCIFGGIGLLQGIWGLVNLGSPAANPFAELGMEEEGIASSMAVIQKWTPYTTVLAVITSIILVIAGIMLLKGARSCLKLNNTWAVSYTHLTLPTTPYV